MAQGNQLTRSSTPSEGGASLDGWMGASQQHAGGAAPLQPPQQQPGDPPPRAASREVKFPLQPSPKSSPVWANSPAAYSGPRLPANLRAGPNPLGRMDTGQPGIAASWDATPGIRYAEPLKLAIACLHNGH